MDIKILKPGDKVLVECTVQAVFANSKMVMVTTRDCTEGFDAYIDEIQEPQTFKWCTDCKEYDQEKHCCHRWSKTIRDTIEEMKQEYIEREVLDKLDEIITDALDKSTDQKESQTLRWVLDKISEVIEDEDDKV